MTKEEIEKKLADAAALLDQAEALQVESSNIKSKGSPNQPFPEPSFSAPKVDEFWKRGMYMGGSASAPTVDVARKTLTATEKMERHTEKMVAQLEKLSPSAVWSN